VVKIGGLAVAGNKVRSHCEFYPLRTLQASAGLFLAVMRIEGLYEIYTANPSIQTDTRKLKPGDLFFALKGSSFNGNTFAEGALNTGASYVVIDDPAYKLDERYIVVEDVLTTLQELARHHRRQFSIPFLAITGSNGKTTTKELVTAVLRKKYLTYATVGNLNNHIGVPLTLLSIKKDAQFAVIEMGANHQQEIASYCLIAEPTHGLITNCGKAHIEGFGGVEGVRKGKGELYDYLRVNGGAIYRNTDLDYLEDMAKGIAEQITYGTAGSDFQGKSEMEGLFLNVRLEKPEQTLLRTHLVGAYNYANVMSAVAVGLSNGVSIDDIAAALDEYNPDNSRSQWLRRGSNQVILDAYNANPTSMKAAIENFAAAELPNKRLWLGAMKEMGDASQIEHRELIKLVDSYDWEEVILVGEEFTGMNGHHLWFANSSAAAEHVRLTPPSNASILIKGSRGSKMEVLLEALPA
jgi:UDP-N-acetylmuramoyl-tripeptide--D-alanyl-D-alanine ligase